MSEPGIGPQGKDARKLPPQLSAGWYPDPLGLDGERYWDGLKWTDKFVPDVMPEKSRTGRTVAVFTASFLMVAALIGGGLYWWFNRGPSIEDITAQTKQDVQEYFNRENELRFITVKEVQLIQVSDHEYKGMVTAYSTRAGERQMGITVTHDGTKGMWQLDRGALLPFVLSPAS